MFVGNTPFKRPMIITIAPQEPVNSDDDLHSKNIIFHQNSTILTAKPLVDGMVIVREDQWEYKQGGGVWNEQTLTLLFSQHIPMLHL